MTTTRVLYTLDDIKEMISARENVEMEDVDIYKDGVLRIDTEVDFHPERQSGCIVEGNSYLIECDKKFGSL